MQRLAAQHPPPKAVLGGRRQSNVGGGDGAVIQLAIYLRIGERLANQGMAALAKQIRRNAKLEMLEFSGCFDPVYDQRHFDRFVDSIERYNCTLWSVLESYQRKYIPNVGLGIDHVEHMDTKMGYCLRRNRRIQQALRDLPDDSFDMPCTAHWPLVLELIGDLPKLLVNVEALCDVVVAASAQ